MTVPRCLPPSVAERLWRHSETRIVVLDEIRVAFLPIPKSGCTSMLWTLAGLAGLGPDDFAGSTQAEVTRAMAVHDMTRWSPRHRWHELSAERRAEILGAEDWLRFTIVRDPAARLWSAWQSKALLAEPRFVERFGSAPWFPRGVSDADRLVGAFRTFVAALDTDPERAPHDAHWGSQTGLLGGFAPTYVGRAEAPEASLDRLRDHLVAQGVDPDVLATDVPRENENPIGFHPGVYDEPAGVALARIFADDLAAWPPAERSAAADYDRWALHAEQQLPLVAALVERHQRIAELLAAHARAIRRAERAELAEADLRASRSWRVTAPLREVQGRLSSARSRVAIDRKRNM
ncbi:MAG: sulfotransferase family 2 domain-containing protein [Nocardioides sp.]|uniref:sulfotransferase family 2 domain-containing protein n=1 Tax=Nocardioides sp. TaxID=35761 RepID=UPI0039E408A8